MDLEVLKSILILIIAGFANVMPEVAARIFPKFDFPMDFNKQFKGKRILGSHKTIRGFMAGIIGGIIAYQIIKSVTFNIPSKEITEFLTSFYSLPWYYGGLVGFGALTGDAIKSFFKRRINIPPGKSWIPFDQIDWVLGSMLISIPFVGIILKTIFWAVIMGFIAHIISKAFGYLIKINEQVI